MWRHAATIDVGADIIVRVASRTSTKTDSGLAARLAAAASLGAAVIHFAVIPVHYREWVSAGLFFAALALAQLIWAIVLLVRPSRPVLAVGVTLNLGAIALWALTRTAGAPLGPHAGEPEAVQAADLCALLLQIYVVMGAGWVLYRGRRAMPIPAFANATVLLGACTVVALATTVGVATGARHGHGATTEHSDAHGVHHAEPATSPPTVESVGTPAAPVIAPLPPAQPLDDGHADHDHP